MRSIERRIVQPPPAGVRTGLSVPAAPAPRAAVPLRSGALYADPVEFLARMATLTGRQATILHLLANGLSNKEIAYRCSVSPSTAKAHITELMRKLGARSRTETAVRYALALGHRNGARRVGQELD